MTGGMCRRTRSWAFSWWPRRSREFHPRLLATQSKPPTQMALLRRSDDRELRWGGSRPQGLDQDLFFAPAGLRQIVRGLHPRPDFGAGAEGLAETDRHLGRNPRADQGRDASDALELPIGVPEVRNGRKTMRQFAVTLMAHWPDFRGSSGCISNPGIRKCPGDFAVSIAVRTRWILGICAGGSLLPSPLR